MYSSQLRLNWLELTCFHCSKYTCTPCADKPEQEHNSSWFSLQRLDSVRELHLYLSFWGHMDQGFRILSVMQCLDRNLFGLPQSDSQFQWCRSALQCHFFSLNLGFFSHKEPSAWTIETEIHHNRKLKAVWQTCMIVFYEKWKKKSFVLHFPQFNSAQFSLFNPARSSNKWRKALEGICISNEKIKNAEIKWNAESEIFSLLRPKKGENILPQIAPALLDQNMCEQWDHRMLCCSEAWIKVGACRDPIC